MSDQLRDKHVFRQSKDRGKEDSIRVSFFDKDGTLVDDITRQEANRIAAENPPQLFYFQDADGFRRELEIQQVNQLTVNDATVPSIPSCPTNPFLCGPPNVRLFGGDGLGAIANAIVSPNSSSVIGFDIVNPGFNYLSPPFAYLEDDCGKGSGGSLFVQMQPFGTNVLNQNNSPGNGKGGLEIKNIVVTAPGDGYLPAPDGSLGGNGRIFADVGSGYVQKADGTLYPVPDGVQPTDLSPEDTFVPVVPIQEQLVTYPVFLEIEEVFVYNPGFGYQPEDTIVIENGDYGAVLEPVINARGEIESVTVVNPGLGFIDTPSIVLNSETGYNAQLIAVLKPVPPDQVEVPPPGAQLISVVDCVGKIPPNTRVDLVPR